MASSEICRIRAKRAPSRARAPLQDGRRRHTLYAPSGPNCQTEGGHEDSAQRPGSRQRRLPETRRHFRSSSRTCLSAPPRSSSPAAVRGAQSEAAGGSNTVRRQNCQAKCRASLTEIPHWQRLPPGFWSRIQICSNRQDGCQCSRFGPGSRQAPSNASAYMFPARVSWSLLVKRFWLLFCG